MVAMKSVTMRETSVIARQLEPAVLGGSVHFASLGCRARLAEDGSPHQRVGVRKLVGRGVPAEPPPAVASPVAFDIPRPMICDTVCAT